MPLAASGIVESVSTIRRKVESGRRKGAGAVFACLRFGACRLALGRTGAGTLSLGLQCLPLELRSVRSRKSGRIMKQMPRHGICGDSIEQLSPLWLSAHPTHGTMVRLPRVSYFVTDRDDENESNAARTFRLARCLLEGCRPRIFDGGGRCDSGRFRRHCGIDCRRLRAAGRCTEQF